MQLKLYSSEKSQDEQKIQHFVGLFCNAVKLFFLVSHSNAMRAYFTFVQLLVNYLNSEFSTYYKNVITAAIHTKLCDLGWIKREMEVEDSNDNDGDKEENYIEGSKGLDTMLVYRRALQETTLREVVSAAYSSLAWSTWPLQRPFSGKCWGKHKQ